MEHLDSPLLDEDDAARDLVYRNQGIVPVKDVDVLEGGYHHRDELVVCLKAELLFVKNDVEVGLEF